MWVSDFAEREGSTFHLPKGNEGEMVERTMRMHMAGGPSIVFERDHWANVTSIYKNPEEIVQTIQTWDANALYPRCMMNDVPVGAMMVYCGPQPPYLTSPLREDNQEEDSEARVVRELGCKGMRISIGEHLWLEEINTRLMDLAQYEKECFYANASEDNHYPLRVCVLQKHEDGRPIRIGPFAVDGLRLPQHFTDEELKALIPDGLNSGSDCKGIVYEYLGTYLHGDPVDVAKAMQKGEGHAHQAATLHQKYLRTFEPLEQLVKAGYALVLRWEADFTPGHQEYWSRVKKALPTHYRKYVYGHDRKTSKAQNQRQCLRQLMNPAELKELVMEGYDPAAVWTDSCDYSEQGFFWHGPSRPQT